MLNPKYLDQIPSDRKLLDRAVSQLDHPPDARAALVSGGCAVLHLPMVPHVISTKVETKVLADAAPNSTHSPISHLPLSRKQEQGRTREIKWRLKVKVKGEVEASKPRSSPHQAQVILILNLWSWLAHELSSSLFGFSLKP